MNRKKAKINTLKSYIISLNEDNAKRMKREFETYSDEYRRNQKNNLK